MNSNLKKINWSDVLRKTGGLAVRAAFVGFVVAMAFAVYQLGLVYGQPELYRLLVAGACALGVYGHGVALTQQDTNASRMLHGVALAVWLVLSIFLAALYMFASSPQLASKLPAILIELGAYVYALGFGIGLFTSTLSLVVPSVARRKIDDEAHPSLGSAVSRFVGPLVLVFAIGVSSLHIFSFGMEVAKVGLMSSIAAMVIADFAFISAEKKVVSEVDSRRLTGRYDRADLVAWGFFALLVGLYLIAVNVFAIRHTAGTLTEGEPMLKLVTDLYGASPAILGLSYAALELFARMVNIEAGENVDRDGVPTLSKIARKVSTQRAAWQELKDAIGYEPKRLPGATTMASETMPAPAHNETVDTDEETAGDGVPQGFKS